ncbi:hypothetical protein Enr8_06940 [Blastopirellula retiformator]|uniref:Uncharacterized protein n=2 Tax=Blastopirellula retiformator TaxID=2527970 RepID=A0A5C5VMQ1_9BACT|nr:hypothetical protein Enr8_06940 [Blastopirellula retiformator]
MAFFNRLLTSQGPPDVQAPPDQWTGPRRFFHQRAIPFWQFRPFAKPTGPDDFAFLPSTWWTGLRQIFFGAAIWRLRQTRRIANPAGLDRSVFSRCGGLDRVFFFSGRPFHFIRSHPNRKWTPNAIFFCGRLCPACDRTKPPVKAESEPAIDHYSVRFVNRFSRNAKGPRSNNEKKRRQEFLPPLLFSEIVARFRPTIVAAFARRKTINSPLIFSTDCEIAGMRSQNTDVSRYFASREEQCSEPGEAEK